MISLTAEYALRAIVCLAADPGESLTTRHIAARTKVPEGYLSKVLAALVRARIIRSRRGAGGGFVLARRPHDINILEVVSAVDPIQRIHECPLGLSEHRRALCPMHQRLDDAADAVECSFRKTRISEILGDPPLAALGKRRPS